MTTRFTVFTKEKTKHDGTKFKVRLTKNDVGTTFEVRFTEDCEHKNLIPKDNSPFILEVNTSRVSMTTKKVYDKETDKKYVKNIIYVRGIDNILDYEEPEFDVNAFNSFTNDTNGNTDEQLPS